MHEKYIELKLCQEVKRMGGLCLKLNSSTMSGLPDRLILLPFGRVAFAELKRKGNKPRRLQVKRHEMLGELGFKVFMIDDVSQIEGRLDEIT